MSKLKTRNRKNTLLEAVGDIFTRLPRGKVLDLGCGHGTFSQKLKSLGFDVVASDMDVARFQYKDEIVFEPSNLYQALPFAAHSFDYVLFLEVIEHLYNPDFVIQEISRVLKPQGSMLLSTPNILNVGSRLRFLFEGSFDFFREPILDYAKVFPSGIQNMHIIVWRYQELEYLLYRHHLSVEAVYTDSMKQTLKGLGALLFPILKLQALQKERRAIARQSVDFRRINKILLSPELLYGKHLILHARKQMEKL